MRLITKSEWKAKPATSPQPFAQKLGFAIHWAGGPLHIPSYEEAAEHVRRIQSDHLAGRNSDGVPWVDGAYNFLVWNDYAFELRGWDRRSAAQQTATASPTRRTLPSAC